MSCRGARAQRGAAARARPWRDGARKVNGTRLSRSHTGIPYLNLVRRKMAVDSIPRPRRVYGELIKHASHFFLSFFPSIVNKLVTVRLQFAVMLCLFDTCIPYL